MRVKYLAGAYRAASGDDNRAVGYYASGYYHAAKRQRLAEPVLAGTPALMGPPMLAGAPPQNPSMPARSRF